MNGWVHGQARRCRVDVMMGVPGQLPWHWQWVMPVVVVVDMLCVLCEFCVVCVYGLCVCVM